MKGRRPTHRRRNSQPQLLDFSTKAYINQQLEAKARMDLYDQLSPRMQKVMKNVQAHIPNLLELIAKHGEDLVIETLARRGHYKPERTRHG